MTVRRDVEATIVWMVMLRLRRRRSPSVHGPGAERSRARSAAAADAALTRRTGRARIRDHNVTPMMTALATDSE